MKSWCMTLQKKKQRLKNQESSRKNNIRSKLKKRNELRNFQFSKEIESPQKLKVQSRRKLKSYLRTFDVQSFVFLGM